MKIDEQMLTDLSLISAARAGDDQASEMIIRRYRNLAKSVAKMYFIPGCDNDDLEQEALIGLFKAILSFNAEYEVSFSSFARLCIKRQIISSLKRATRKKNEVLNNSQSIDASIDDMNNRTLLDQLPSHYMEPEKVLFNDHSDWLSQVMKQLPHYQKQVLDLRIQGLQYAEIARRLGRSEKSVDNALYRIRLKIMKKYSEHKSTP